MIPYVTLRPLDIGGMLLQPFALLVSFGVLLAHFLLVRRAGRLGLARAWAAEFSLAMVAAGFVGAVAFKLLYRPELLAAGITNLRVWPGISSFGGLFGALAGGFGYLTVRRAAWAQRWRYLDAASYAFPAGFAFGRLGCTVTHDHPGRRAVEPWLATVAYPDGPRYDLGLLEMLFLAAGFALFVWLDRRRPERPPGFFFGTLLTSYGVFRVALDQLHVDPPRYAGISVDQWSGGGLAALGFAVLLLVVRRGEGRPL